MKMIDAISVLKIESKEITENDVKKAYRSLSKQFHPDINRNGLEMMKLINSAYERLLNCNFPIHLSNEHNADMSLLDRFLEQIIELAVIDTVTVEVCGTWIWVTGDTKPYASILKKNKFWWSKNKQAWYWNGSNVKSKHRGSYSLDEIRGFHGSKIFKKAKPKYQELQA